MPFNESIATEVLGKCARRCCICRRFKPTQLQVHHIQEESKGGTNTAENAIPVCRTCHADVHSKIPFSRRFTQEELRVHRDETYRLVAEGKLVTEVNEVSSLDAYISSDLKPNMQTFGKELMNEAVEILIACAESKNGDLIYRKSMRNTFITAGALHKEMQSDRERAMYEAAIEQLETVDLVVQVSDWGHGGLWKITNDGYMLADEITAQTVCGNT